MSRATKKRAEVKFKCSVCGEGRVEYHPRCSNCGQWNTYQFSAGSPGSSQALLSGSPARRLDEAGLSPARVRTGLPFFDELTGGGMVSGASVLIYGRKGAGKSTLAAQAAFWTAVRVGRPALIVSGEEWIIQVRDRVDRLGMTPGWIWFNSPVSLPRLEDDLQRLRPSMLVIDSVQKLDDPRDGKGGFDRKKRALEKLLGMLRELRTSVLLLSQVNKQGTPMGGEFYEHEPDAVIRIDRGQGNRRVLVATKNRFGPETEVETEMTAAGLVSCQ